MGVLRRVLLGICGVILCAVAVVVGVALINRSFAATAIDFLDNYILYNIERCFLQDVHLWLPIAVGLALFLLGVVMLTAACHRKQLPKHFLVAALDGGSVQVSFSAIDNVVKRAASSIGGASNINNAMQVDKKGLHIRLSLALASDVTVYEAGAQLRQAVTEQLGAIMGVTPASVDVAVTKVVDNGNLPPVRQEPQFAAAQPAAFTPPAPQAEAYAPQEFIPEAASEEIILTEQPQQPEVTDNGSE